MEIEAHILAAGTEAVIAYRDMSGCRQDNEAPEMFISSLMAIKLHEALGLLAKAEHQYTQIAEDLLGQELKRDRCGKITGFRADIALYNNVRPMSLIEVKKFAEGMNVQEIDTDLHKGDPVLPLSKLVYAAVMVCETENGDDLGVRKEALEGITGSHWQYSNPVTSRDGAWRWCFCCGRIA